MSKEKEVSRSNLWKWLTLLVVAVGSAYLVYPEKDADGNSKSKIRLGLDLKGGSSFTLGVDMEQLKDTLIAKDAELEKDPDGLKKKIDETLDGSDERIVEIIRRRIDSMGTSEPQIQPIKGKHQILVQIPGAKAEDRDAARERLERMAYLEFHLVPENEKAMIEAIPGDMAPPGYKKSGSGYRRADDWSTESRKPNYATRLSRFALNAVRDAGVNMPVRMRFVLERDGKDSKLFKPRFVQSMSELEGKDLASATASPSDSGIGFQINFELNDEGAEKFGKLTGANKGRQLAIILDGEMISSPVIQGKITSRGQITGSFTMEEAKQLASDLNAGALPAPLKIEAESTIDPTVGQDAISRGKWAALIGFALVAIFMLFYYWYVGAIADVALFLDIALLPAALFIVANLLSVFVDPSDGGGNFQLPVLTMPGIAGLVLTLGMAVDANVLIFERIREEFSRGATVGKAVENGYSRAFTAILDSNLTTIITGCILYSVGTGPVRGFAIMLTGGVVISMFTALVVTRLIIDHTSNPAGAKPFKMCQFFKAPNIDFMKYGKTTLIASGVIVAVLVGIFAYRVKTNPQSVLALDLTGGTSITFSVPEDGKPKVEDLRARLEKFDNAIQIQYGKAIAEGKEDEKMATLLVKTGRDGDDVQTEICNALSEFKGLTCTSSEYIGAAVGDELKKSGTQAVLFSLVAILIYIGFRFRFGFGLGGLVALAHDALIALGVFSILGHQVSLIVITALLTIVGYSINDTVVVFDRIRELLKHDKRMPFKDLCNAAINSCLSRTVITSVTTFFAVAALFIFGEGSIYDFALTMLVGVVAGTYSSIFIATPIMAWCYKGKRPDLDDEEENEDAPKVVK
ncbi:MAG: protein translocase subunit SecD [Kiritimatiellae bacterium]|nr:protein translocase subunit SecD [Kiritimatiellia bacterium]